MKGTTCRVTPLALFTLLLNLLHNPITNITVLADEHDITHDWTDSDCSSTTTNPPDFIYYHIHVLFWPNNAQHTDGALQLRNAFIDAHFSPPTTKTGDAANNCTMSPANPAPGHPRCVFPINLPNGRSPFLTAEFAFFVPKEDLQRTTRWMVQHRGVYDVLIHPNTGCSVLDHTDWAMWAGDKWELDTTVFGRSNGGGGGGGNGDGVGVVIGGNGVTTEESSAAVGDRARTHGITTIESNSTKQSSSTEYSSSDEDDDEWDDDEEEELDNESWSSVITVMVGVLGFVVLSLYAFAAIIASFIKMGTDRINDYEGAPTTDDDNRDYNSNDVPNGGAVLGGEDDVEGSLSSSESVLWRKEVMKMVMKMRRRRHIERYCKMTGVSLLSFPGACSF